MHNVSADESAGLQSTLKLPNSNSKAPDPNKTYLKKAREHISQKGVYVYPIILPPIMDK